MPLSAFLDDGPPNARRGDAGGRRDERDLSRRSTSGGTGGCREHLMTPHPLLDYETDDARKQLAEILGGVIPSYGSVYSGTR